MTEYCARLILDAAVRGDREAVEILGGKKPFPVEGAWLFAGNDREPEPQVHAMLFLDGPALEEATQQVAQWARRLGVKHHTLIIRKAE